MRVLGTKQIYVTQPTIQQPPALPVQFVKPVSYEFRVAEHLNEDGVVEKVGLQVQVYEHDEFGSPHIYNSWTDVPRVKIAKDGSQTPVTP